MESKRTTDIQVVQNTNHITLDDHCLRHELKNSNKRVLKEGYRTESEALLLMDFLNNNLQSKSNYLRMLS
jgi:hypothetical protein